MMPRQKNLKMTSVFTRGLNMSTQYLPPARNRAFNFHKPTRRLYHMRASICLEIAQEEIILTEQSQMEVTVRTRKGCGNS